MNNIKVFKSYLIKQFKRTNGDMAFALFHMKRYPNDLPLAVSAAFAHLKPDERNQIILDVLIEGGDLNA